MQIVKLITAMVFLFVSYGLNGQSRSNYDAIYSGVPLFDDKHNVISAHGACIIKDNGRFYLFGEAHTDTSNAFAGFNCYSSEDLYNWRFESLALPVQNSGKLGPNRVGERVKVMKSPKTGEYVMYMHVDTLGYKDQFLGYATSTKITGPYTFHGPLLFNNISIRKWDMGAFQDKDGSGYVLLHGGDIYKLSDDYKSITQHVHKEMVSGFESPTLFRKNNIYYFLGSHLTSWERNDNEYYTSTSLSGPWTYRGLFAPKGSLTWNSQSTFVFPIEGSSDTTYMFMGDRWSYPKQNSSATYVWQPLVVSDVALSIPSYKEAWKVDLSTGKVSDKTVGEITIENNSGKKIKLLGSWQHKSGAKTESITDSKGASVSIKFKGSQIGLYSISKPSNGYARIILRDKKGRQIIQSIVDMYSLNSVSSLTFISPVMPKAKYILSVFPTGERPNWADKRRSDYGSTGYFISLDKIVISK
ncbi:family 43 glycosylhydrolase [Pedobacter sp. P351]|uniref:family 43 glycosylhydrolase n=1 Tax=Pedobacter superstes TaxID=3133441 RepID=UPI0030AA7788